MKLIKIVGALLIPTVGLAACAASSVKTFSARDRARITELLDEQRAAWNRGDIEAFMDGYARSPDLVFTSGGQVRKGWDETLARYRDRYGDDTSTMGQLSFEVLGIQPVGSDGAVVLGRWGLRERDEPAGGIFSVVVERRPEGWRVVHDHTSADASTR